MNNKIPSENLAELIIDRLIYAKCINQLDFSKGVMAAKRTINSRKALQDYDGDNGLESFDIAMLIINDLVKNNLIAQDDFEKAVDCADEEIIARQAAGDY